MLCEAQSMDFLVLMVYSWVTTSLVAGGQAGKEEWEVLWKEEKLQSSFPKHFIFLVDENLQYIK
jgi:hypothetical protein